MYISTFLPMFLGAKHGDNIQNYLSQTSGWYVNYDKNLISKEKKEYASLRDERIFAYPKIYITRTGNPFKAFIDVNTYASNNFFSIQFKDYAVNSYKNLIVVLGLLNSSFANYYIRKIIAPSLGDTFVETKIIHLLKLPLQTDILNSVEISNLVDRILEVKKADPTTNTTFLEKEIDRLVYDLYELTEEEIELIERETG